MTDREVRQWAERVVELYAGRAKMTLLEQGELERDIAGRFRAELALGKLVPEWIRAANDALDSWERSHPQRGIRVAGFSESGRQVFEKRRG